MESEQFDKKLAAECARAFSQSTGLGCTLSDREGRTFGEYGYGCESCGMCAVKALSREQCVQAHIYGMTEAERFGGKCIYFCPRGLTCFVSPIFSESGAEAKITVGPFIMVEKQDFIDCELVGEGGFTPQELEQAVQVLEHIPYVPPQRVNALSTLLFMAVGFLNNVSVENRMLDAARAGQIQGQVTAYIQELKQEGKPPRYPFELEHALLQSIARQDKRESQRLLNELLGAILFTEGSNLELAKSRLYELLVLVSRTVIDQGGDGEHTLRLIHEYRRAMEGFRTIDALCLWLSDVINGLMDSLFRFIEAKHANVIHRCTQYIGLHYNERITLEDTARQVYLSPEYLSRIFRRETGSTFSEYVNRVRVAKAKELMASKHLSLTEIALLVGYEDQSYFTKVFKRFAGMLPREYREKKLQQG